MQNVIPQQGRSHERGTSTRHASVIFDKITSILTRENCPLYDEKVCGN